MENAFVKTDSHILNVQITSSTRDDMVLSERKFDKGITVQNLKDKLELITGARSQLMTIEVFDQNNVKVCDLKVRFLWCYVLFSFLKAKLSISKIQFRILTQFRIEDFNQRFHLDFIG